MKRLSLTMTSFLVRGESSWDVNIQAGRSANEYTWASKNREV
jgi:hypothetical protein